LFVWLVFTFQPWQGERFLATVLNQQGQHLLKKCFSNIIAKAVEATQTKHEIRILAGNTGEQGVGMSNQ